MRRFHYLRDHCTEAETYCKLPAIIVSRQTRLFVAVGSSASTLHLEILQNIIVAGLFVVQLNLIPSLLFASTLHLALSYTLSERRFQGLALFSRISYTKFPSSCVYSVKGALLCRERASCWTACWSPGCCSGNDTCRT